MWLSLCCHTLSSNVMRSWPSLHGEKTTGIRSQKRGERLPRLGRLKLHGSITMKGLRNHKLAQNLAYQEELFRHFFSAMVSKAADVAPKKGPMAFLHGMVHKKLLICSTEG